MNKQCWIAVLCVGFVSLLGGDHLWAADPEPQQLGQLAAKMQKDGWKEIADGVFERQLGPNKVERLGHGRDGVAWTLGELNRKLASFQLERESYPSEKLDKIIEDLSLQIAKYKAALWKLDRAGEQGLDAAAADEQGLDDAAEQDLSSLTAASASCSSICYSATADAYHLTSTQGVGAVANASFNSACGYSGETFAYSYARATQGTTTTTHTQSDPDSGTSVTSAASSTVNGGSVPGIPCYSEASSYALSNALGISYSTSDVNDSYCPAVACTATIYGTSSEYFSTAGCRSRTWTVSLSGGCTASTYQWKYNGTVVGTGSSYTRSICPANSPFTLEATVNGAYTDTHYVDVWYEPSCGQYAC